MTKKYKIFTVKYKEISKIWSKFDKCQLIEEELYGAQWNYYDTIQEAEVIIEKYGEKFKEYTILPIYAPKI